MATSSAAGSSRSYTAPAGRISTPKDEPGHSGVSIPAAHEAMRSPPGTADHPDYMAYYADVTPKPADRVGLPPPKYWSKFAGRIPPKGVLKRLSQDGSARSRLITRLAAAEGPSHAHVDPAVAAPANSAPAPVPRPGDDDDMLDPSALIGSGDSMAAAHAKLLAKPALAYAADEEAARLREDQPRTQPVSAAHSDAADGVSPNRRADVEEEETEVTEEMRIAAAARIQRRCRWYLGARRGHRLLGMLHVVERLGTSHLFGPGFPDLLGISVRDQVNDATLHHAMAIALEYECRLHSENFARALLAADAGAPASFRRAVVLEHAELRDVVEAGPVEAAADVAGFETFADFFGGSDDVAALCMELIDVRRHASFGRSVPPLPPPQAAAPLSPGALGKPQMQDTGVGTQTGTSTTASVATSPGAARTSTSPAATSSRAIAGPPLDDDELQLQSELGIPATANDDDDDSDGEVAALNSKRGYTDAGFSAADMSTAIEVPRGWAGASVIVSDKPVSGASSSSPPGSDVWGAATFEAGGGFVDLDDLRRRGGHGAAIMRPKSSPARQQSKGGANKQRCGECVVCELDSIDTVACPCGNWVHADCGAPGPEPVRCCKTCRERRWEAEE